MLFLIVLYWELFLEKVPFKVQFSCADPRLSVLKSYFEADSIFFVLFVFLAPTFLSSCTGNSSFLWAFGMSTFNCYFSKLISLNISKVGRDTFVGLTLGCQCKLVSSSSLVTTTKSSDSFVFRAKLCILTSFPFYLSNSES